MHRFDSIDPSIEQLRATFSSGKTKPIQWRILQLSGLLNLCSQHEKAICQALKTDLHKSDTEAYLTEIGYVKAEIKHTIKHLKRWMKPKKVATPLLAFPASSYHLPEPLGVVFIMGAWNFPFQLVLAPLVAAIAAGNCAILKPSELTQATSSLIAELIPQYLDEHAFVVFEGGKEISTALLSKRFDHIFYTGGDTVGKIVMQAASKYLTPVTLELGGKSPCIVDKDADLLVSARRIVWGKWTNAGQICIAPDYLLVHSDIYDAFITTLKQALKEQFGQDPQQSKDYGRIVNESHFERLVSYIEAADGQVIGGQSNADSRYIEPTLLLEPSKGSKVMQEEIFGPILPVMTFSDHNESIQHINNNHKPLALYLFCKNEDTQTRYLQETSCGNMCINDTLIFMSNAELAFGGVGNSGMGRYHGQSGFELLSNMKAVMKRPFALDVFVRYAPYNKLKLAILRKLQ
jgi:aldehyde dehydrogenase (NAD+)